MSRPVARAAYNCYVIFIGKDQMKHYRYSSEVSQYPDKFEEFIRAEDVAQLALRCGFDTSGVYDSDDLFKLFENQVEMLREGNV